MYKPSCTHSRIRRTLLALAASCVVSGALSAEGPLPPPDKEPPIIAPGPAPSDAVVLFNGKDLYQWSAMDGKETKWILKDDVMQPVPSAGYIRTKDSFGDCQLHLEFATPSMVEGEGQARGNSGVFFGGGRYEVQVLDSYNNKTYYHGQCAAVYKQYAPLVNASRKPGEWQTYDIVYHAPRFDSTGNVTRKATLSVLHNGILVQDHVELMGTTSHDKAPKYQPHPVKQPIAIQDHGNPVRFRNIWIRPL